ncbi:MAG: SpoVR family protein [Clostridiaceae bacterium]
MSDYSMRELEYWNKRIEEEVGNAGLDCYEQEFELVSYEDMTSYEAYIGMPSHYPHWSFGKAYERIRTLNRYNLSGLPYEMVINSNPCIAYLMKDNSLLLQILTMSHVYGHNDFFKNNRLFKTATRAEYTVEIFKNHAARIREYISDPAIGYAKVEKILSACHALRYQCPRTIGAKKLEECEIKKRLKEGMNKTESDFPLLEPVKDKFHDEPDLKQIPLEPEEDLLLFIAAYGRLEEWERDIIDIVREETQYFLPQIETKTMNEGWASYWHYCLMNKLELPQQLHFEFLRMHNQVVKPHEGHLNPYYLGFKIFDDILKKNSSDTKKIFEVRHIERDESFIRRYLTQELCCEMKLYEYEKDGNEYVISEVADETGWMKIRDTLANSSGLGGIPCIRVAEWMQKEKTLLLEHIYDGRELEMNYANETLKHLVDLWEGKAILNTVYEGRKRSVICDEQKKIIIANK